MWAGQAHAKVSQDRPPLSAPAPALPEVLPAKDSRNRKVAAGGRSALGRTLRGGPESQSRVSTCLYCFPDGNFLKLNSCPEAEPGRGQQTVAPHHQGP